MAFRERFLASPRVARPCGRIPLRFDPSRSASLPASQEWDQAPAGLVALGRIFRFPLKPSRWLGSPDPQKAREKFRSTSKPPTVGLPDRFNWGIQIAWRTLPNVLVRVPQGYLVMYLSFVLKGLQKVLGAPSRAFIILGAHFRVVLLERSGCVKSQKWGSCLGVPLLGVGFRGKLKGTHIHTMEASQIQ